MATENKIVIGMTGPFGSGCSYISRRILADKFGYKYISLSELLRSRAGAEDASRTRLQDVGNQLREEEGNDVLARMALEQIQASECDKFVVDSIRNTHEVDTLHRACSNFYLFAIQAGQSTRWERVKEKYRKDQAAFEEDDRRDRDEQIENGQQITLCYQQADAVILNERNIPTPESEAFSDLKAITKRYVDLIEGHAHFEPTEMETLMTMAYANSLRSTCSQRKVGALIIDEFGNVFSSGYNEVPTSERSCRVDYGGCYRKFIRADLKKKLQEKIGDETLTDQVSAVIKENSKMLDHCRALHAEETAIVNMARLSVSADLARARLYTTTYPCNLCANKIAQVGIKEVVYFEPYPQKEAKEVLAHHNVKQTPFEGVTYNGYFRFMEVLR